MRFNSIRRWLPLLLALLLVACGGGGGTPTLGGSTGTTPGSSGPVVQVALSSSTVTAASPATVTITLLDASGNAIDGAVVDVSMERGTYASLSLSSVRTDAKGMAVVILSAATAGLSGADKVIASAKLTTTTVTANAAFMVIGSQPTIGLLASATTLKASTGAATLKATVKDAAGNPVNAVIVAFSAQAGNVILGAASAITDASGTASITVAVKSPALTAADSVKATATVTGQVVQSSVALQLLADTPSMTMTASSSNVSTTFPATLTLLVKDASGNPAPAGTVISLSSGFGLTAFDAATVATNSLGFAQAVARPQGLASSGADQIVASASVGGVIVTAQTTVVLSNTATSSVMVSVSPTTFTPSSPATVTVTVRDSRGSPVSGAVVDLSTLRGNLATLSIGSVATGANGTATATLSAQSGAVGGADQVLASTSVGLAVISGSASFTVAGSLATMGLTASSTTLRSSSGAVTFSATLRDAQGQPVPNQPVTFGSIAGRLALSAGSSLTNASGVAQVTATVADPTLTAAETVTASSVIGSVTVQASVAVQLIADQPTMTISASVPTISAAGSSTLSITVRDANGLPVGAGTVVNLASTYGLTAFDAVTVATGAGGVALVVASPKTASSNGADVVVASAVVGGVPISKQMVLQVQSLLPNSVTVALSSATITVASPATVTVTVRDAKGAVVPGALVDLSTVRGTVANLAAASVATNAFGVATTTLTANSAGITGADQVVGVAKGGAASAQGVASFAVTGAVPTLNLTASATSLRLSTGAIALTATLKDAAGAAVAGQSVAFSALGGKVNFDAPSKVTDAAGMATVNVTVADASLATSETLTAAAKVGAIAVQSSVAVQLVNDTPSIKVTVSSSNVTAAVPATLSVLVKDTNGVAVPFGTIVSVKSTFGLSAFDVSSASTNGVGVATVTVSPKSASSNGADQIVASATVGGVPISDSVVVQVTSSTLSAPPVLNTSLSSTSISSATPAVVTSTLTDGKGQPAPGQVVTFSVVRGLAKTNVATALTDSAGNAVVVLSPINSTIAGADEVQALANFAGSQLQSTKGFQIQATNVSLSSFTSAVASLGAYGQTTLTIGIVGASIGSPVNVSVTSSCVSQGKATLSPSTFTATTATVDLQFKDNGCGALQLQDKLQASITGGSGAPVSLSLPIVVPSEASLAFISASPEVIFLKGSGFTETSTLTFEVRDRAGNPLPQRTVDLALLTAAGGVTIEGGPGPVALASDAAGRVSVRVNSGTVPTPIRVRAALHATPSIATVSSNLSVAVGLPSQLNFSMSQTAMNIEGMNLDGTPNAYNIIASDRSGNPVPAGTSINFVTEGGQVESIKQIQLVSGLARTSAGFISSAPRPDDGRIVVVAYALGEESFIDQNGNNTYDVGEPFQDLGSIYKDRIYDGIFDAAVDEYIPTGINNTSACSAAGAAAGATAVTNALLALDVSIPSIGASSCDGKWSGAGQVYVRRAVETVLSTSTPRALWSATTGLDAACSKIILQNGPSPASSGIYTVATGTETWYSGGAGVAATSLNFLVADANTFKVLGPSGQVGRLNPMAAGTTITAGSATSGVIVKVYGDTVPSTTEATGVSIGVDLGSASSAPVSVTFTSPVSKTATSYTFTVTKGIRPSACP